MKPDKDKTQKLRLRLGLSEAVPKGYIHQSSHKQQNQRLSCDIDRQAQERFERLIEDMKQAQGITEHLEAENALD